MKKTLYRCQSGKMICGVCKGVSEYLDVDVSLVRIIWGVSAFCGVGFLAYFISAFVLPEKQDI